MIFTHHLDTVESLRHLTHGTVERSYYTAGYLQALKDTRELIREGEFPCQLDNDGGPKIFGACRSERPACPDIEESGPDVSSL